MKRTFTLLTALLLAPLVALRAAEMSAQRHGGQTLFQGDNFRVTIDAARGGEVAGMELFDGAGWNRVLGADGQTFPQATLNDGQTEFALARVSKARLERVTRNGQAYRLCATGTPRDATGRAGPWIVSLTYEFYPEGAVFIDVECALPKGKARLTGASVSLAVDQAATKFVSYREMVFAERVKAFESARVALGAHPELSFTGELQVMVEQRRALAAQFFEKYLKRNWDGLYVDWHGPQCVADHESKNPSDAKWGDSHFSPDGNELPCREYFLFTRKLRERVGPDGFLIGHQGIGCAGILPNLVFDEYLPGEYRGDHEMFSDRDAAVFRGMTSRGSSCTSWCLDSPIFITSEGAAKMVAWGFYPRVALGIQRSKGKIPRRQGAAARVLGDGRESRPHGNARDSHAQTRCPRNARPLQSRARGRPLRRLDAPRRDHWRNRHKRPASVGHRKIPTLTALRFKP